MQQLQHHRRYTVYIRIMGNHRVIIRLYHPYTRECWQNQKEDGQTYP